MSTAALLAVVGPATFAMAHAVSAQAQLLHANGSAPPSFEVATIKPNMEDRPGPNIQLSPANFAARHTSFKDLITFAYHIKSDDQIVGGPSWMSMEFYDIHAKASEVEVQALDKLDFPQKMDQPRLMIQSLLVDRFQLKVSFRTQDLPVYALVVGKTGSKLTKVEPSPFPPPGTPPPPGAHLPRLAKTGPNQYTATAWPMNQTVDWLSRFSEVGNRIVIDETGLAGSYDFVLNGVTMSPPPPPGPNAATPEEATTSIFTALQEQLGLKLEPKKAPIEVLVIDHVERPSEN
jgi:uncharacterized protein (TIGR03435 family)